MRSMTRRGTGRATPATGPPRSGWAPRSATSSWPPRGTATARFDPRLVPKGQRRVGGLIDMIISLYAGGMTIRDIQAHLARTLGTELSHETISNITDAVARGGQGLAGPAVGGGLSDPLSGRVGGEGPRRPPGPQQGRPHRRRGRHRRHQARAGDLGPDQPRGRSFGPGCCAELRNRGVRDVLIVCCDGLTGFPEAIEATWPHTVVQTCVVHLIRASMRFVSYNDRKSRRRRAAADLHRRRPSTRPRPSWTLRGLRTGASKYPATVATWRERLGAVHPVPGVPARAAQDHLHHQQHRVA